MATHWLIGLAQLCFLADPPKKLFEPFAQYKARGAQLATWPDPCRDFDFLDGSALYWCLLRVRILQFDVIQNPGHEPPCKRIDLHLQCLHLAALGCGRPAKSL